MSARRTTATLLSLGAAIISLAGASAAGAAAPSSALSISDLPRIVASGSGSEQLALVFKHTPDASTLRAGIAASSAVARLSRGQVTVLPYVSATPHQILNSPTSVIEIIERPGETHITLQHLKNGNVLLVLAGHGANLVDAAELLSTRWIGSFNNDSTYLSAARTNALSKARTSPASSEGIAAGSHTGGRSVSISRQVVIPVDQVIRDGAATFKVGVEYDAPGGGHLTFKLNGYTLGASRARGAGNTFVYRFKVASVWTDGPKLQPGYYLTPGANTLTVTAKANKPALAQSVGTQLAITPHSRLAMKLSPRRKTAQLATWPFPLYANGTWAHTTVVTAPFAQMSRASLSALISALANTARVTGVAASPQISFGSPSAAERHGNLLVYGNPRKLAGITPISPLVPGLITEQGLASGGYAVLATDTRAMSALAGFSYPGYMSGRSVVIDSKGHAHTIINANQPGVFLEPDPTWLKPLAGLGAVVLAWIAFRVYSARRRLRARPDMPTGGVIS